MTYLDAKVTMASVRGRVLQQTAEPDEEESMYFLKGVAPMSGSEYSSSDSEATLDDIPPIVIDADLEEEENMSDMSSMLNLQGPDKLGNNQPLDIVPLNSIPFRQEVAFHQKVDSSKEEVPVPQWMKQLDNYKDGDWTVFLQIRDDGHKDWVIPTNTNRAAMAKVGVWSLRDNDIGGWGFQTLSSITPLSLDNSEDAGSRS
ncbi:Os04g0505300 [Oryza sativa Japonica Group]|uniref:Os04g0505300 protein n=1 Tax=Oryza sativa subsp. japonica TaxID=39947 RepID=Q0JBX2_ORYSJ|nr:Os04g0505300 [Oryza sativa Japonica Group]|eukprot:NP_001053251.1 Os04g0505300 [Oryza sativa Japonica Group]